MPLSRVSLNMNDHSKLFNIMFVLLTNIYKKSFAIEGYFSFT